MLVSWFCFFFFFSAQQYYGMQITALGSIYPIFTHAGGIGKPRSEGEQETMQAYGVTRCRQESLALGGGHHVGIRYIDVSLRWPSFLPGRLCLLVTVLREPSQHPLWGPQLCPSGITYD